MRTPWRWVAQGVGAAIASPTSLSLITTTFPIGPARNRAFAVYAAMSGAGAAVGLILGGALTEISWRWTFFINFPIGVLVAVLAPRYLAESERHPGRFDLPGAITGTLGLGSLVYGLTTAATDGWDSRKTIGFLLAGAVLLVVFLVIEANSRHALMPFRVIADRDRGTTYVAMLAIGAGMFAMFYFLGIFIQNVLGYSSFKAGLAFLPFSVGVVVAAQVASTLASRIPPRFIAAPGAVIGAAGMIWLTQLTPGSSYLGALFGPILVISIGMGLAFVPLTLTAVSGVDRADAGVASAVLNTMQQIGGALGLATLSTVATSAAKDTVAELTGDLTSGNVSPLSPDAIADLVFTSGATAAFAVAAGMVLAAAIVIMLFLKARPQVAEAGVLVPGA
jgi:predicted MFS family arabinose efflux permease